MSIDKSVSKRINVTLPDSVVDELEDWANAQGRSVANLAAFLLKIKAKFHLKDFRLSQKRSDRIETLLCWYCDWSARREPNRKESPY